MGRQSVLAVGAHPDDIELGCGGALAKHVAAGDHVTMLVVTRGEEGPGDPELRIREQLRAVQVLGVHDLLWGQGFGDCRVSLQEFELVHLIEDAIAKSSATMIYTHTANDSHQDHRVVSRCTLGAARWVSSIMTYGGPSALGFNPTAYIDISDCLDKKVEALMCHDSQVEASEKVSPSWVRSSAEHYGFLCRRPFAEGFEPARVVVDF
ncbi:LmbE family N-acetylglucosaminyl deacetylase [Mycobacterium sp. MAA66]|jgi:LmbE family N-acetylglucosaminyl deacetylase|uniref:PIG-L deacetylase family protein n=1 Tax=Mycobacterium sp. MAA66 TaxID=3156297 RepID=UPI0035192351